MGPLHMGELSHNSIFQDAWLPSHPPSVDDYEKKKKKFKKEI